MKQIPSLLTSKVESIFIYLKSPEPKDTIRQIEKALIYDRYVFQMYPESFAFQQFITLQ